MITHHIISQDKDVLKKSENYIIYQKMPGISASSRPFVGFHRMMELKTEHSL